MARKGKAYRKAERVTWGTLRNQGKEPNYDQWWMNKKPDPRTKEQIAFDSRRKKQGIVYLVMFLVITLMGLVLASS